MEAAGWLGGVHRAGGAVGPHVPNSVIAQWHSQMGRKHPIAEGISCFAQPVWMSTGGPVRHMLLTGDVIGLQW